MKRLRLLVSGRVQGVWFRESTRQEAERLGVTGWVRNLPDGRVEAVLEGETAAVQALAAWCRRGPERAWVEAVEQVEETPTGSFPDFRVER
ncbi:MAG TPA: acylphosphatase [Candidatus Thermoplasmatota archaeon]|nr:acylphosphatase [Candidatus Thermoplasmatota archaeon]